MAYNSKSIIKDADGKPVPQYFNAHDDEYQVLQGADGANRVVLYDATGTPVDIAALVGAIITALSQVEVTESALPAGAATSAKQDTVKNAIDTLAILLTAIKDTTGIKKISDQLPNGTNRIGKVTTGADELDKRGLLSERPVSGTNGTTYWATDRIGQDDEVTIYNGTSWVVI